MQFKIKLYGFTNELLGKIKGSVFPSDIPESELPDHFSSVFDQKIASIFTELDSQPIVDTYTSHSLLEVSFVALNQYRRSLLASLFAIPPPIVVYLIPFRRLC